MKASRFGWASLIGAIGLAAIAHAAQPLAGADVSALPDVEAAGGIFRDHGKPDDELAILKRCGVSLFRVRLFVDPDPDPKHNWGATQSLPYVKKLAQRIKAIGGTFLLDLHYSDTWADPQHQSKPAAWKSLEGPALEKKVAEYTTAVIKELQAAGCGPDMVQVGNEITAGMLWPNGQIHGGKTTPAQWQALARLVAAGCNAVRAAEEGGHRIRIVIHVDSGGVSGVPQWFFKSLLHCGGPAIDFDIIGLSFYPEWGNQLPALKKNMAELAADQGKDVFLAEVGFPWAPIPQRGDHHHDLQWPQTSAGQADFLSDVQAAIAEVPNGHGLGWAWWFSDALPTKDKKQYLDGNEALFDHAGNGLPALDVIKAK